jgi:predicted DNA-binding antitoxin AbrB/MazE fold protein
MAIRATYSGGVLRLIDPLDLPDNTEVEILLLRPPTSALAHRERVRAALRAGGLLIEHTNAAEGLTPLNRAERAALQQSIPADLNLSQAIIEGREEAY